MRHRPVLCAVFGGGNAVQAAEGFQEAAVIRKAALGAGIQDGNALFQRLAAVLHPQIGQVVVDTLHLAYARPFGRLKAPLGLSLLHFAAQTRTTLFLLCTKSCIVWRKIGVWRSFYWKFLKRKSLKLLGLSRNFRLCFA